MKKTIQKEVSLNTLAYFFNEISPYLEADLAFQASPETRWSDDKCSNYVTSLIRGMAPSPFIFANVDTSLQHAIDNQLVLDIEYYNDWKERGIKFLNIDSNNRTINLKRFIDDEFPINSGTYVIDDTIYEIVRGKNDLFSTLPDNMREYFMEVTIHIVNYTTPSREELSEIFVNINDGQPLNHAEKRNALTSNIASEVRTLAERYKDTFYSDGLTWFSHMSVVRRGIDDFIAGMAAYYFSNDLSTSFTNSRLWDMYQPGSDADQNHKSFSSEFVRFMKFYNSVSEFKSIPNRNSIFDLWVLWCQMKQDRREFSEQKKQTFVSDYIVLMKELLSNGESYAFEGPKHIKGYEGTKPFEVLVGGRQASNNIMRNKLIRESINLSEYTFQKDSKRSGTKVDKFILAVDNNFKTYEGKDIDPSKLHTSEYHIGHKKPHSQGGSTNRDNLVIQEAHDNFKTGTDTLK